MERARLKTKDEIIHTPANSTIDREKFNLGQNNIKNERRVHLWHSLVITIFISFNSKNYGIVYNTHSGAIVSINNKDTWDALLAGELIIDERDRNILQENLILVNSFEEEIADIKRKYLSHIHKPKSLYITLMPTETCNFACPYCFLWEKSPKFMTESIFDSAIKYICKVVNCNSEIRHVTINWYGGEPTICSEQICRFMNRLREISTMSKCEIMGSITTNGYLLTLDTFKKLLQSGVSHYQVTVDGTQDAHNKGRPHKTDQDSYSTIMDNLIAIRDYECQLPYKLDIRCNFTKSSISAVDDFLDVFHGAFSANERFSIYCRPVYEYETKSNDVQVMKGDILTIRDGILQQNKFAEKVASFRAGSAPRRMVDPLPQPTPCWCNAEVDYHVIIGADANIYFCETLIGNDFAIGKLLPDGSITWNNTQLHKYDIFTDDRTQKCMVCKLLPICMGGCLRNRLQSEASCYWCIEDIQQALQEQFS